MEDMFEFGELEFDKVVIAVAIAFDRGDMIGGLKAKLKLLFLGVAFVVIVKYVNKAK